VVQTVDAIAVIVGVLGVVCVGASIIGYVCSVALGVPVYAARAAIDALVRAAGPMAIMYTAAWAALHLVTSTRDGGLASGWLRVLQCALVAVAAPGWWGIAAVLGGMIAAAAAVAHGVRMDVSVGDALRYTRSRLRVAGALRTRPTPSSASVRRPGRTDWNLPGAPKRSRLEE
jgi:hypothetical protein